MAVVWRTASVRVCPVSLVEVSGFTQDECLLEIEATAVPPGC
jgi:hypothetical protein